MRWQDIVISIVQICFILALIPTIRGSNKPAFITAIFNVGLVLVITFCLLTLRLWFSALTSFAIAMTWAVITYQTIGQRNKN